MASGRLLKRKKLIERIVLSGQNRRRSDNLRKEKLPVLMIDGVSPVTDDDEKYGQKHTYHFGNGYKVELFNSKYSRDWELHLKKGDSFHNTPFTPKGIAGYIANEDELRHLLERISNLRS